MTYLVGHSDRAFYQNFTCDSIEWDISLLGGRVDVSNQELDNLQCQVLDLDGKLVKLAALKATFDHFTKKTLDPPPGCCHIPS